jgi:hypothetical protein
MKTVGYTTPITGATVNNATITFDNQGLITAASSGTGSATYATTVTAAGTTTLTNASALTQYFTGATTQTVVLPVVTTLANGWKFKIVNLSTGFVTVQSSGFNTITVLSGNGGWATFTCINIAGGTGVASWSIEAGAAQGSGLTRLAIGYGTNATNTGSIAIGGNTTSTGTSSVALGANTTATGNNVVSIGGTVTAGRSTAIGVSSACSAADCVSIGFAASTTVANATAISTGVAGFTNSVATTMAFASNSLEQMRFLDPSVGGYSFRLVKSTQAGASPQTLTAAQALGGYQEVTTAGAFTLNLDTGANLDANAQLAGGLYVGQSFRCTVAATGAATTLTVAGAAGTTLKGVAACAANASVELLFVRTGAAAWDVIATHA